VTLSNNKVTIQLDLKNMDKKKASVYMLLKADFHQDTKHMSQYLKPCYFQYMKKWSKAKLSFFFS